MVIKRNAMRRNLRQSILRSLGRYIAIAAIIAVGAGIFVGLLMTKADMVATGQDYMDEQRMFDIRLISTYGWDKKQVSDAEKLEGVVQAEGIFYTDLIARYADEEKEKVYRFYTLPEDMNQIVLLGGRLPEKPGECLVDGFHTNDSVLGRQILLTKSNDRDALEDLRLYRFTVVGYVSSPLYMDMNRGTTSVGNGSLEGYVYLPRNSVKADYVAEIHLKLDGTHAIYSDEYNDFLEDTMDAMDPMAQRMGQERFEAVKAEAEAKYQDGYQEYLDGVDDYEEGKAEAEQELADALKELQDGEQEISDTYQELQNAERTLYEAKLQIEDGQRQVKEGKKLLEPALEQVQANKPALEDAKKTLEQTTGMSLDVLASLVSSAPDQISALETAVAELNSQLENPELSEEARKALREELLSKQTELAQLQGIWAVVSPNAADILRVYQGLQNAETVEAEAKKLKITEVQLEESMDEVKKNITKVYDGYEELKEAEEELADGWEDYYEGKAEAEQELADARQELEDAKIELADARKEIDDMDQPDVLLLDRNSNVGYTNLDSASDIVQGVSRVFPVFFLLIASLVCITTMTRMIEEERTQIGTLKALGYGESAIISKYLIYAGSSALVGCGVGIAAGCTAFPMIIWEAYKIMLQIKPNVVLTINWPLAIAVVAVYTAVILAVTWYCCHRTLKEVPAELIRPRAPEAGKALFVEKLPFWRRISFLNKVTIRNIFRYRQRLAMMLVGIGGCTALLVTGFGLRDSIINVVDYQYEDVTRYDLSVYFREDLDQEAKEEFLELLQPGMESMFYHQSSVEIQHNNRTKEVYMISAGEELTSFIHFHRGEQGVSLPGVNEAVLSVGVADLMGIQAGDTLVLRDSDMKQLEVTVSGIYDNHVENYVIVSPQTMEAQWGSAPGQQMALVTLPEGTDVHTTGAHIAELHTVMNVSVSEDMAHMVQNMMAALDLVIIVIVFCAGLLAVTVLYNLTNININERIREIATIKVLGFNASETSSYVFKENMALTVAGAVLGLGLGYALLLFVISQIKIDMVWFKPLVFPASYVYSIVLTLLAAVMVNFIFYFKLQKINMAEALKSVE